MMRLTKSIGMALLVLQILFLSAGIHDLTCHTPNQPQSQATRQEFASPASVNNPETHRCNACFFNQLLNQCLLPVFEGPFLTESFSLRTPACSENIAFVAPGNIGNRGPPSLLS